MEPQDGKQAVACLSCSPLSYPRPLLQPGFLHVGGESSSGAGSLIPATKEGMTLLLQVQFQKRQERAVTHLAQVR